MLVDHIHLYPQMGNSQKHAVYQKEGSVGIVVRSGNPECNSEYNSSRKAIVGTSAVHKVPVYTSFFGFPLVLIRLSDKTYCPLAKGKHVTRVRPIGLSFWG